jgi:glucokinase
MEANIFIFKEDITIIMENILAIDIGGSKILVGIVDSSGNVIAEKKTLIHQPTQASILYETFSLCDVFIAEFDISCIGVSIPGLVDPMKGLWLEAVFSKVRDFRLGDILEERYHVPVFVENDANNCAYGEKTFGNAKEYDDFIWLTISNGCGAGVFLGGKLFTGQNGHAGELGHLCVTDEDYICPCGNKGCLEAVAAGPGITYRYKQATGESLSAKEIATKAKSGDIAALTVYHNTGEYIGKAIAAAVNVLNVPLVVLGGGIAMDYDLFKDNIFKSVQRHIYRTANKSLLIMRTKLGYQASLIGAAANALDNIGRIAIKYNCRSDYDKERNSKAGS